MYKKPIYDIYTVVELHSDDSLYVQIIEGPVDTHNLIICTLVELHMLWTILLL